ncbi:restriction endonuclease subunit S [Porticoccus litoralis]|uniref:Restriction endonuclease subunit S n=1 Tax=Porticoccus litoralis TaxID=434086 RepID=A0AAW8AZQ1_9GAMM|nr:restriction endonuclease subunit S [Porticoccus litoralis]MDP1519352.1 restriction endonuclease subunit S [Porticoccus litoralis]
MWNTVKLGDVCSVFTDGDWIETKDQSSEGIRLIQTGNVKTGAFAERKDKARYISEKTFMRLNCTEVKEGDILVSRLPEPVGRACVIPKLKEKAITAVDCTVIRTKESVLPTYLNYYMQSPQYFSAVQEKVTGATRQRISRKNLGEVLVTLPPLAKQQRIVAKLDAAFAKIDSAIKLVEAKQANAEKLKASLLAASLTSNDALCKTVKLGDVCKIVNGGTPKSNVKMYWEGDIQWLTPKDMGKIDGKYVDLTERQITKDGLNNSSAKLVPENSVILSCRAPIGHVFINTIDMSFNQGCKGLVPTAEIITEYLYYFLFSSKQLLNDLGTGTTFKEISGKTLANVELLLPPLAEQQCIVAKLNDAFAEIDTVFATTALAKENYIALKSIILAQELNSSEAA